MEALFTTLHESVHDEPSAWNRTLGVCALTTRPRPRLAGRHGPKVQYRTGAAAALLRPRNARNSCIPVRRRSSSTVPEVRPIRAPQRAERVFRYLRWRGVAAATTECSFGPVRSLIGGLYRSVRRGEIVIFDETPIL